jgi:hypothetical protein
MVTTEQLSQYNDWDTSWKTGESWLDSWGKGWECNLREHIKTRNLGISSLLPYGYPMSLSREDKARGSWYCSFTSIQSWRLRKTGVIPPQKGQVSELAVVSVIYLLFQLVWRENSHYPTSRTSMKNVLQFWVQTGSKQLAFSPFWFYIVS